MFSIEVTTSFFATHALRLPRGGIEPAHAHLFQVTARLASEKLDELETVVDFHGVEEMLEAIVRPWRSGDLNEIEPFKSVVNPSAERIAEHIGQRLQMALSRDAVTGGGVAVVEIRVTEAANCVAIWSP